MRSGFLMRIFLSILLGLSPVVAGVGHKENRQPDGPVTADNLARAQKFACLPKDVQLDDVVSYGRGGKGNITVENTLIEMRVRCRKGRLVDAKRREIRFFRLPCWGNPPADYLEIQQQKNEELAKLKKRYRVIVFGCNPMIP